MAQGDFEKVLEAVESVKPYLCTSRPQSGRRGGKDALDRCVYRLIMAGHLHAWDYGTNFSHTAVEGLIDLNREKTGRRSR